MINKHQAKQLIKETLLSLDLFSEDAVNLMLGTMAQESDFGTYLKELKSGSGLSFFRMTPEMHDEVVKFLKSRESIPKKIKQSCGVAKLSSEYLLYNIKYSICMVRIHYFMQEDPIPRNIEGYAKYWKEYYNTRAGDGTISQFIFNYKRHVL